MIYKLRSPESSLHSHEVPSTEQFPPQLNVWHTITWSMCYISETKVLKIQSEPEKSLTQHLEGKQNKTKLPIRGFISPQISFYSLCLF